MKRNTEDAISRSLAHSELEHRAYHHAPGFTLHEPTNTGRIDDLAEDVRRGLTTTPKTLPSKYFYDERGSYLFELICDTEEYYPTRTERALLERHAAQILGCARPATLVELGSGTAVKTDLLLSAADKQPGGLRYVPIDVSRQPLMDAGVRIIERFEEVEVAAFVGEYEQGLRWAAQWPAPRLFAFLGGTIGNFDDTEALALLGEIRGAMQPGDRLLLGVDRVKDPAVLHKAYNDAQGLTAEFNLNMLRVINRRLGADFRLEKFCHQAFYDITAQQIEMHLVSSSDQIVTIDELDLAVSVRAGESIRTEISRKFTLASAQALLHGADMRLERVFEPPDSFFSLMMAQPL